MMDDMKRKCHLIKIAFHKRPVVKRRELGSVY